MSQNRSVVAARVRREKELHPDRFCKVGVCLWREQTAKGRVPCDKHTPDCPNLDYRLIVGRHKAGAFPLGCLTCRMAGQPQEQAIGAT